MRTRLSRSVSALSIFFMVGVALFLLPPSISEAASNLVLSTERYIIQPGPVEGKDTFYGNFYYQEGQPDHSELWFGGWGDVYYSFIDFDLVGSPDEIVEARLELFSPYIGTNDPGLQIWQVIGSWDEGTLSAFNQPPATFFSDLPLVKLGWNSYDITELYILWKRNPSTQFGIEIVSQYNDNTRGSFFSSDDDRPQTRPRLVITY